MVCIGHSTTFNGTVQVENEQILTQSYCDNLVANLNDSNPNSDKYVIIFETIRFCFLIYILYSAGTSISLRVPQQERS